MNLMCTILSITSFVLLFLCQHTSSFTLVVPNKSIKACHRSNTITTITHATNNNNNNNNNQENPTSRRQLLSSLTTGILTTTILPNLSYAEEPTKKSIKSCPTGQNANKNCVSTSNIKQLDNYLSPWTFEVAPSEAFARIKGVLKADYNYNIVDIDEDQMYLKAETRRSGGVLDVLEFIVNADDKVVVFKSGEKGIDDPNDNSNDGSFLSDFGQNRKRMESIRKKGVVFDVMGSGLNMDDYYGSKQGSNGPLGQLKAFYGLQSGKGFEEVVLDK